MNSQNQTLKFINDVDFHKLSSKTSALFHKLKSYYDYDEQELIDINNEFVELPTQELNFVLLEIYSLYSTSLNEIDFLMELYLKLASFLMVEENDLQIKKIENEFNEFKIVEEEFENLVKEKIVLQEFIKKSSIALSLSSYKKQKEELVTEKKKTFNQIEQKLNQLFAFREKYIFFFYEFFPELIVKFGLTSFIHSDGLEVINRNLIDYEEIKPFKMDELPQSTSYFKNVNIFIAKYNNERLFIAILFSSRFKTN